MKYIHILDEFSLAGGGVRSVVADVSQEMAKMGLEVYIFALGIPQDSNISCLKEWAEERNINFNVLRREGETLLRAARNLRHILYQFSREDKVCLYLHLKRGVLVGILGSIKMKNIRRVEVFHSNYINYKAQALVCKYFLDHHLPVSKESQQQLISEYGIKPNRITLAYNGLDLEKIRGQVIPIERNRGVFRFLSVGRMAPQKNLETSIKAYSLFKKENESVPSEYLIAGDGPQRSEFESLAAGDVSFMGMIGRGDVISNIASADVVLFPSLWEGHSIALLEVLAIGCPVIVTDIPSFREVLENKPLSKEELFRPEPFGAVFHKGSVESCKAAIEYMAKNKEQHKAMKDYVSSLAENYTLQKQTQIYVITAQF